MSSFSLPIIIGSTRPERRSPLAAYLIKDVIVEHFTSFEPIIVDPLNFDLPYDGAHDPKFTEIVSHAQAFVIVIPEYNHGYPGKLKTLLDSEYDLYKNKPVLLVGWSSGGFGGTRATENFIPVARRLGLIVGPNDLNFSNHSQIFDKDGTLLDLGMKEKIITAMNEFQARCEQFKESV